MRAMILAIIGLACCGFLSSCDLAFAEAKITQYVSTSCLMGIIIKQDGNKLEAEMVMYNEAHFVPDPAGVKDGERQGGMPFALGIVDKDTNTLVFPLQNNSLMQANSATLLRKNKKKYVEFDLDFTEMEIEARWRQGDKKPSSTHKFLLCGVEHE